MGAYREGKDTMPILMQLTAVGFAEKFQALLFLQRQGISIFMFRNALVRV